MSKRTLWQRIRTIWITTGLSLTAVFVTWCLIAYRANADARAAARNDAAVAVSRTDGVWAFASRTGETSTRGLIFYPGALVDPRAYAPLVRAVASAGHSAFLVELPKRGAFGGADDPRVLERTRAVMNANPAVTDWVIAGHSKGAVVTSSMAHRRLPKLAGVVLIGTTHPRDVDLSTLTIPVVKVVGTRDGVAPMHRSNENRHLLPANTRWVEVEGGNHSQFAWYGFQPGDKTSRISRADQQRITIDAVLCAVSGSC